MSEPVMCAIQWDGSRKPDCDSAFPTTAEAEDYMKNYAKDTKGRVVLLYAAPPSTLTDAERNLLRRLNPSEDPLACYFTKLSPDDRKIVYGLLQRLGGGA